MGRRRRTEAAAGPPAPPQAAAAASTALAEVRAPAALDRGQLADCLSQTSKIAAECNSILRDLLRGRCGWAGSCGPGWRVTQRCCRCRPSLLGDVEHSSARHCTPTTCSAPDCIRLTSTHAYCCRSAPSRCVARLIAAAAASPATHAAAGRRSTRTSSAWPPRC